LLSSAAKTGLTSDQILERFFRHRSHDKRLALTPAYFDMLEKLGNPHKKLPPVFHVAGTNGKGSTCAFLRAMLEAAGYKVHVYTSPHLIRFHERIRIAGKLIGEDELVDLLTECERIDSRNEISDFEAATAAAFAAFARHPADFTILETGLGGRLDATNVVEKPLATLITRISYDHRDYLGETLAQIAREKAGIMRENIPCFTIAQPDAESRDALKDAAAGIKASLKVLGENWRIEQSGQGFRFIDERSNLELPPPGLPGRHQYENAGLAIAALSVLPKELTQAQVDEGLRKVAWPARLQRLEQGRLKRLLPQDWELWLDGGHNDSAGEALAAQIGEWRRQNPARPVHVVCGMLTTKRPQEFLKPFAEEAASIHAIAIPHEAMSFSAEDLAAEARAAGSRNVEAEKDLETALEIIPQKFSRPGIILVCGSLYLAGHVLAVNGK